MWSREGRTQLMCLNHKNVDFISRLRKPRNRNHTTMQRVILHNSKLNGSGGLTIICQEQCRREHGIGDWIK